MSGEGTEMRREDPQWLDAVRLDGALQLRVPLQVMPWVFHTGGRKQLLLEVDGEPKKLVVTVPAGTQPGQVLRLRGVALGTERADVYVELRGLAVEPRIALTIAAGVGSMVLAVVAYLLASAGAA